VSNDPTTFHIGASYTVDPVYQTIDDFNLQFKSYGSFCEVCLMCLMPPKGIRHIRNKYPNPLKSLPSFIQNDLKTSIPLHKVLEKHTVGKKILAKKVKPYFL